MKAVVFVAFLTTLWALSSPVDATHEVDHRFTVEGFVCGPNGQSVVDQKVIVKDTRVSLVTTAYTDSYGYYKALLHLHNDNLGDPILIIVGDEEQRTEVQFDPGDRAAERSARVDFGTGCETQRGGLIWVLAVAGVMVVLVVAYAGARMIRKRRRAHSRGKGSRK